MSLGLEGRKLVPVTVYRLDMASRFGQEPEGVQPLALCAGWRGTACRTYREGKQGWREIQHNDHDVRSWY